MAQPAPHPSSPLTPYLTVNGAVKAATWYQQALGAELVHMVPPAEDGRTMHVQLRLNGQALMLSDAYPEHGHPWKEPAGFTLHLQMPDVQALDARWARAVDAGATVTMPLAKQFWGDRYGQFRDPFGNHWSMGAPSES